MRKTPEELFWEKVDKTDTCWNWTRGTVDGYGALLLTTPNGSRGVKAHRFSYEMIVGPIPEGLVIDHLCRNRACVNPDHMEPVTIKENVLRGVGAGATHARRTACSNGHEFTPENTRMRDGARVCITCRTAVSRASKARIRARSKEQNAK